MSDPIQPRPDNSPVPVSYAEKTMASLLQLHAELMEEKERRVDLYRRLMEKDEALAEMRYQVKLLEDRLRRAEGLPPAPLPQVVAPVSAPPAPRVDAPVMVEPSVPAQVAATPVAVTPKVASHVPARVARTVSKVKREDWRQW